MVTSNKQTEKKVVKMTTQSDNAVVPHRTLLGEVNEHITCPLCRGYYIDATTIVECLHSFCRSCIIKHLQVKKYCPVCEMMINSAKPNIKLDKALQDIVYKLVPGLFQKEMERRQQFYSSRPGPAASATPEQRGEDTERIIFSPEDVISFSLEYSDVTDTDSISSKSSDSNESQSTPTTARRYLQCPAVVNISHLKKFLSMKFDIDSTQFAIDILYKRVPLPDYYTLMDIAYIYNWKRNEPMRFFYQIIDYVAIRNRLFDLNRKVPSQEKIKAGVMDDVNSSNLKPNNSDQASEASSGTDSPMLDEMNAKKPHEVSKKNNNTPDSSKVTPESGSDKQCISSIKKSDDDDEKSQFLNSFELTAKNSSTSSKTSPCKNSSDSSSPLASHSTNSPANNIIKVEDSLKRKCQTGNNLPEMKKVKIELEKAKLPITNITSKTTLKSDNLNISEKPHKNLEQNKETDSSSKISSLIINNNIVSSTPAIKDAKQTKQMDSTGQKRCVPDNQSNLTPKRKPATSSSSPSTQKTVSPLKIQLSKTESPSLVATKAVDIPKSVSKKIPDLKPSIPGPTSSNKGHISGKLRMDLLANNSDPTIDRSKILSQVKTTIPSSTQNTGENLKSLFDSCKINIPSSLSITLTDQKSPSDIPISDQKKNVINKNLPSANSLTNHKVPSPPVHNYIEIKKLPDTEPKKLVKSEGAPDSKPTGHKADSGMMPPKTNKPNETSSKGPVPNLKPIADTKLAKQGGNSLAPITFQQTFEKQLQSLQSDTKTKVPKNKTQVPQLVPATPKTLNANKLNAANNKSSPSSAVSTGENKSTTALDLSTPHTIKSQLGPQQTKAFETMQSIANLAKKQNLPPKSIPLSLSQNMFPGVTNRPITTSSPVRNTSNNSTSKNKSDKSSTNLPQLRQDITKQLNPHKPASQTHSSVTNIPSPNFQGQQPGSTQPSPRSQTRSPSSSPKLVIAEEKQSGNTSTEQSQNNTPLNPQLSNMYAPRCDSPKDAHSLPKPGLKPLKSLMPTSKIPAVRQPITPTLSANTAMSSQADYLALFRHQMEMRNVWLHRQQYDMVFKNIPNMALQNPNDFNSKDKQ